MIAGMTKNFGNRVARKLSFSLIASASYALVFVIESTTRRGSLPRRPHAHDSRPGIG
jgi:hypothetical protein